jgi:hypothetical protein
MMRKLLVYIGGILTIIWGISHIFPTHNIVKGFGNISADNINIVKMEWLNEGFSLMFLGLLVVIITLISETGNKVARVVYLLTFIMLTAMSVLSLFTGFKIDFIPFKLCPLIFMTAGLLILSGFFHRENSGY